MSGPGAGDWISLSAAGVGHLTAVPKQGESALHGLKEKRGYHQEHCYPAHPYAR